MRSPVRIFSDLHLGHGVSRILEIECLRPLVAGAGTVIFNGDTWQELSDPWRERSLALLNRLRAICEEEGADAVFLPGNHDPGWGGAGWLELAGGKIVVTHGDAFFNAGSPWKREIFRAREEVREKFRMRADAARDIRARMELAREIALEYRSKDYADGRSFFARAWDAATPPLRAGLILWCWWQRGRAACDFLDRYFPDAEVLVFGHFHMQHAWRKDGRLLIDTGSFLDPGRACWVEWDQGCLRRGWIDESAMPYRMGEAIDAWRLGE